MPNGILEEDIFEGVGELEPTTTLIDRALGLIDTDILQQAVEPVDVEEELQLLRPSPLPSSDLLAGLLGEALESEAPNLLVGSLARRIPQAALRESLQQQAEARAALRREQREQARLGIQRAATASEIARRTAATTRDVEATRTEVAGRPFALRSAAAEASLDEQKAQTYAEEFSADIARTRAQAASARASAAASRQRIQESQNEQEEINRQRREGQAVVNEVERQLAIKRAEVDSSGRKFTDKPLAQQKREEFEIIQGTAAGAFKRGLITAPDVVDKVYFQPESEQAQTERRLRGEPTTNTLPRFFTPQSDIPIPGTGS